MVSTHLTNMSQIGSFPQVGLKIKNLWNHHLDTMTSYYTSWFTNTSSTGPFSIAMLVYWRVSHLPPLMAFYRWIQVKESLHYRIYTSFRNTKGSGITFFGRKSTQRLCDFTISVWFIVWFFVWIWVNMFDFPCTVIFWTKHPKHRKKKKLSTTNQHWPNFLQSVWGVSTNCFPPRVLTYKIHGHERTFV